MIKEFDTFSNSNEKSIENKKTKLYKILNKTKKGISKILDYVIKEYGFDAFIEALTVVYQKNKSIEPVTEYIISKRSISDIFKYIQHFPS